MAAIIQHSKNLVMYYGYHTGVILMKASNTNDVFWIDFEDFVRVKDYCWYMHNGYVEAVNKYDNYKILKLHRLIVNAQAGLCVDHRSGDKLDNRKSNLREATQAQNNCNRTNKQKNNTSGFKGVAINRKSNKWQATLFITIDNERVCLSKLFNTREDAARQYNEWARQYHGEFARLNDI